MQVSLFPFYICFHILAVINSAIINIGMLVFYPPGITIIKYNFYKIILIQNNHSNKKYSRINLSIQELYKENYKDVREKVKEGLDKQRKLQM